MGPRRPPGFLVETLIRGGRVVLSTIRLEDDGEIGLPADEIGAPAP
jgi:hypothetical protein